MNKLTKEHRELLYTIVEEEYLSASLAEGEHIRASVSDREYDAKQVVLLKQILLILKGLNPDKECICVGIEKEITRYHAGDQRKHAWAPHSKPCVAWGNRSRGYLSNYACGMGGILSRKKRGPDSACICPICNRVVCSSCSTNKK